MLKQNLFYSIRVKGASCGVANISGSFVQCYIVQHGSYFAFCNSKLSSQTIQANFLCIHLKCLLTVHSLEQIKSVFGDWIIKLWMVGQVCSPTGKDL